MGMMKDVMLKCVTLVSGFEPFKSERPTPDNERRVYANQTNIAEILKAPNISLGSLISDIKTNIMIPFRGEKTMSQMLYVEYITSWY